MNCQPSRSWRWIRGATRGKLPGSTACAPSGTRPRFRPASADLTDAARDGKTNLMYPILDAVNVYATLGEITGVFRQVFGEYQEPVFF